MAELNILKPAPGVVALLAAVAQPRPMRIGFLVTVDTTLAHFTPGSALLGTMTTLASDFAMRVEQREISI